MFYTYGTSPFRRATLQVLRRRVASGCHFGQSVSGVQHQTAGRLEYRGTHYTHSTDTIGKDPARGKLFRTMISFLSQISCKKKAEAVGGRGASSFKNDV